MKHLQAKLIVLAACAILSGCEATCGNESIASISSPDGKSKAVVFNRNCGATTGFNTQVSIVKASDSLPNEGGNLLILEGTVPLTIHWVNENQVFIAGVGKAKAIKREKSAFGVTVTYE